MHWIEENVDVLQHFEELLPLLKTITGTQFCVWDGASGRVAISPELTEQYDFPAGAAAFDAAFFYAIVSKRDRTKVKLVVDRVLKTYVPASVNCRLLNRAGGEVWVSARIMAQRGKDSIAPRLIAMGFTPLDDTQLVDAVTGFLNQVQFNKHYHDLPVQSEQGYVVVFGVDELKTINTSYGWTFGDDVMRVFAECLDNRLASSYKVYRLGSGRFAVEMPDKNSTAVTKFYEGVKTDFTAAVREQMQGLYCTISAGAAAYPQDADNYAMLWQFAESALTIAKTRGRNNLIFFTRETFEEYQQEVSLRAELRRCVRNGCEGFKLHFQPLIDAKTGAVFGAEALLRWSHGNNQLISPTVFIPILESHGMIYDVGRWVIEHAMEQCAAWRKRIPDFRMNINVSYLQLENEDIADFMLRCLRHYQLPGSAVLMEITESAQLHNYQSHNQTLARLNRIGIMVAIDDFGTGYSSLGYLKDLNVNQIKIDQAFVKRICESKYDQMLVRFIIELAHSIGVKVCVEGVEREEELDVLLRLFPDCLQGFLFGKPCVQEDFEEQFIRDWGDKGKALRAKSEKYRVDSDDAPAFEYVNDNDFVKVLEEVHVPIVVSGMEDKRLIWMNRWAIGRFGDYRERGATTCHQFLFGCKEVCADCDTGELNPYTFTRFEHTLPSGEQLYTSALPFPWQGELCRLTILQNEPGSDVTDILQQDREELKKKALAQGLAVVRENEDIEQGIIEVLAVIGNFYSSERVCIFELEENVAVLTYEWCRATSTYIVDASRRQRFHHLYPDTWMEKLERGEPVMVENTEALRLRRPKEAALLQSWGQAGATIIPIFSKKAMIALLCIDTPRFSKDDAELGQQLSYCIESEISRRNTDDRLMRLRYTDPVTGLYNRSRYLKDMAGISAKETHALAAILVDLGGVPKKTTPGKKSPGDALIVRFVADLKRCFEGYILYRVGGNEFAALGINKRNNDHKEKIAQMWRLADERGYQLGIGSTFAQNTSDIDALVRRATGQLELNRKENERQQVSTE